MYAGFVTPKKAVSAVGIHQRFDRSAYFMIQNYIPPDSGFPSLAQILTFEGYNGPDGIKAKQGLKYKTTFDHAPSHLYDPLTDTGEVPAHIAGHYFGLVASLVKRDTVRAAFEASWLAHYVCDGLTPSHHWPLESKITDALEQAAGDVEAGDMSKIRATIIKHWIIWGPKGHMFTHIINFEIGIALALLFFPIKAVLSETDVALARKIGAVEYFKIEARKIATLDLYNRFYQYGWTNDLASVIKRKLAPETARVIGTIWLVASIEASQRGLITTQTATIDSLGLGT